MWTNIALTVLSLLIGILGNVICKLFLDRRLESLQGLMLSRRSARSHRRVISAFVEAIRGRAAVADTMAVQASMAGLILSLGCFALVGGIYVQNLPAAQSARVADIELISVLSGGTESSTPGAAEARKRSVAKLADMKMRATDSKGAAFLVSAAAGLLTGLCVLTYASISLRINRQLLRRRFAHEVDRFTLRIQGLANKTELADLALAESRVVDETSLRAFIDTAIGIAARHGIPQLARPFDLWARSSQPLLKP